MTEQTILFIVAIGFAVVTGANDGSSLLSPGIPLATVRITTPIIILTLAVCIGPFISTRVATTFTRDLVNFSSGNAMALMAVAVGAAMLVVLVLALCSLPTSLGFAVIGGILGTGLGAGLSVDWGIALTVLGIGFAAPLVAGFFAYAATKLLRLSQLQANIDRTIKLGYISTFTLLAIAYSFSGSQKMLAVFAIASGIGTHSVVMPDPISLSVMGVSFAFGIVLGLPAVSSKLSFGLYAVRPQQIVTSQTAAGLAAFTGSLAGAPISMTQGITGGLVGAGIGTGGARVRWLTVVQMVRAWALTLPASIILGAVGALTLRMLDL